MQIEISQFPAKVNLFFEVANFYLFVKIILQLVHLQILRNVRPLR